MDILFITPEVFPFARAGGLGDVSHYLPQALAERGHRIRIVTPMYRSVGEVALDLSPSGEWVSVPLSWRERRAEIYSANISDAIQIDFISNDDLYNRAGLYGNEYGDYEDNAERFIFFCRAALEHAGKTDFRPDVIHCHDWASGLVPLYSRTLYKNVENISRAASVFTFHNLGSQGIFWHYDFTMTGLDWEHFTPEGLEFHGQMNMTKAGLVWADLITTVSRRYAREVLTPEFGFGLEGVLKSREKDIRAVLNGVDYAVWDPAADPSISANYSADDLAPKARCRADLIKAFQLEDCGKPIVAVISRLLDRKGFDLISAALDRLLKLPIMLVFMGMGEDKYHFMLDELVRESHGRIGAKILYDKSLAHRIIAGSDMFLMPSRYEPCGLEQMYGLKYGAVPVVRATGGLDDTIIDMVKNPDTGTGFKFHDYTPEALLEALASAQRMFEDRKAWEAIMKRGMRQDFSWANAAENYEDVYNLAVNQKDDA